MTQSSRPPGPTGALVVAYAAATYACFLLVLLYAIGFFATVWVPTSIDDGTSGPAAVAVAVDLALLGALAVQHSVMARPGFKRRWLRVVPAGAERATYVLAATALLALLFWCWRPIDGEVWRVAGPGAVAIRVLYAAGWLLAVGSTFLISHADLFGLRQAWQDWRRDSYVAPRFTERSLYRFVRHPLMVGFVVVFWSAPVMSAGHLLFALAATGYVGVGVALEERDLARELGAAYLDYRTRVPAFVPGTRPRTSPAVASAALTPRRRRER